MKRILGIFIILSMAFGLFAEDKLKIAVLQFKKNDSDSQYIAGQLMKRDFKSILKKSDKYELIKQKKTDEAVKKSGYTNLMAADKADILSIGDAIGADIMIWGNVKTKSHEKFVITSKILSKKTGEIKVQSHEVTSKSKDRKAVLKKEIIDILEKFSTGAIDNQKNLGLAAFDSRNWADAAAAFERVYELDNQNIDAIFYLTQSYYMLGQYEKSIEFAEKGIAAEPENKEYYIFKARSFEKNDDLEQAAEAYKKAYEVCGEIALLEKTVNILVENEETEALLELADSILETDENNLIALTAAANTHYDLEDYESAIPYLEKAVELDEENEALQKKLAKSYSKTDRLDAAIENYKSVLASNPKNIKTRFYLANAYRANEQLKEALNEFKELQRLDPENPKVYQGLADAAIALNKFETAAEYASVAKDKNPSGYEGYLLLAVVYEKKGYGIYNNYITLESDIEAGKQNATLYGEKLDKLIAKRDNLKAKANATFKKSISYLNQAAKQTDKPNIMKKIKTQKARVKELVKQTKAGQF
ncbi:MAG: hypothetical protein CSB55_03810 [Candidatus Cloacimonadota bacterium]|nr:MAG: hypothetical protein CSB55_03810 [Candidatus Cloacimonadota bacterium]